jgi:hypothetical protein
MNYVYGFKPCGRRPRSLAEVETCLPLLKPNSYDGIELKLPGWRRASLRSPDGALC